jgi:DNA-binding SARP family transcriptional activator
VQALLAQAQLDLDAAQFDQAFEFAHRVITIEPWHEQAALIAMRASLAKNDRPAATRLYRILEQTLRADLGLAPMPELRALYQTLLNP